jgi:hypothetical protein
VKDIVNFSYVPRFICILSLFAIIILTGCQAGKLFEPKKLLPEKAIFTSIQDLNQTSSQKNFSKVYPDGVKVKAYVVSYYKGGPVNKEIIGLSTQKPQSIKTDYSEIQTNIFCGRESSPGSVTVKVGDEITVAGFIYPSSVQDNLFLEECQVIP